MLPDVDPQKRRQADSCTWVLVRGGRNLERTRSLIIPKPAPARALHGDGLRGKLFLKLGERAKVTLDELKELSVRRRTVLRRGKVLPENGVVDVPSAVELDRSLKGDHRGVVALDLCFRVLLHRHVKVGDVRVVVLGVVQLHDLAADDGLERSVVVIEIGQLCRDEGADLGGVAERSDRPGETTNSSEHGENPAAVHCALWFCCPACYFFSIIPSSTGESQEHGKGMTRVGVLVSAFLLFAVTLVAAEEQHTATSDVSRMEFQTCSG